jgi:hypothetical protein
MYRHRKQISIDWIFKRGKIVLTYIEVRAHPTNYVSQLFTISIIIILKIAKYGAGRYVCLPKGLDATKITSATRDDMNVGAKSNKK